MDAYRHVMKTPALGRFLVPWDGVPLAAGILAGFFLGINLVFLLFFTTIAMVGLFWIRKTGEGTLRAMVLYRLRRRLFLVE